MTTTDNKASGSRKTTLFEGFVFDKITAGISALHNVHRGGPSGLCEALLQL